MSTTIMKDPKLKVVKRDGKKDTFQGEKIAVAIKKGFDGLVTENSYTVEDANKVYEAVIEEINKDYDKLDLIKIEDIQDLIEKNLKELGYEDVMESFATYRERRNESRKIFKARYHKLTKAIETLTLKDAKEVDLKRDNANVDGDTAMGTMLQYGSTLAKEFAKSYQMQKRFAEAHDSGLIHIHDMDFLPMGTTTCCQIDLNDLFKDGFSTGHGHLRCPNDIMSYSALAAIAIQSNQNDQHGGQSIPAFDYFMAPGVLKTFKKQFKQMLYDYLELDGFLGLVKFDNIVKQIDKLTSIEFDISEFSDYYANSDILERIFKLAYDKALSKTDRITYQAMEAFIHNLNTMHSRAGAQVPFSSINFGTDTSNEGRLVMKNYLLATDAGLGKGETPIFPVSIFKVKEGINYNKEDKNYDLFKLACRVSAKRLFPNFSFIDAPHNLPYYKEGDYNTEIAYMGCRTRVISDVTDKNNQIVTGRGNLSFTSINLPRIGIKHGICLKEREKPDMKGFFEDLGNMMDLVKDQLLERFEIQCSKRVYNFPFLLGQGIWNDGEKLGPTDRIRKLLKHGSLSIGFIGLAETLKALIGEHHGESEEAEKLGLKIIKFMRERCDQYTEEYNLNFVNHNIHNAGYEKIGSFKDMNISDIISIINVNIKGMTAINIEDYKSIEPDKRTQVLFERLYEFFEKEKDIVNRIMMHNEIDGKMAELLKRFMLLKIREIISSCECVEKHSMQLEIIIMHYSNTLQMVLEFCFLRKDSISKEEARISIDYLLGSLEKKGKLL